MQEVFNFDDIGSKIKSFAKWACWIEIVLVWIGCAIGLIASIGIGDAAWLIFVLAAVVAPFLVWVGYWILYAVGEMADAATKILYSNMQIGASTQTDSSSVFKDSQEGQEYYCKKCWKKVKPGMKSCPHCGAKF